MLNELTSVASAIIHPFHHRNHFKSTFGNVFVNQIPAHMWCPTSLMVNGVETRYPLPEPGLPLNFLNSTGMRYEAEEVRRCLLNGNNAAIIHAG